MRLLILVSLVLSAFATYGCNPGSGDCADPPCSDDDIGNGTPTPTEIPTDTPDPTPPRAPLPFTIDIGGDRIDSARFTRGTCESYTGTNTFRQRYRAYTGGDNLTYILTIVVDGTYAGAGSYNQSTGARVELQANEAGNPQWASDEGGPHTVDLVMAFEEGDEAWGTVTVSGLSDDALVGGDGDITISPATLTIWCDDISR